LLVDRRRQHLAERAEGGHNSKGEAAFFFRHDAANGAQYKCKSSARCGQPDDQPGAQMQPHWPARIGQGDHAKHVKDAASRHHAGRAEAVRIGGNEGLAQADDQILDGDGQRKYLEIQAQPAAHRRQEQPEALPCAGAQDQN